MNPPAPPSMGSEQETEDWKTESKGNNENKQEAAAMVNDLVRDLSPGLKLKLTW